MKLEIVTDIDKLNKPSQDVAEVDDNIRDILKNMLETMISKQGLGLAAVQVGLYYRIFIMNVEKDMYKDCEFLIDESKSDYLAYGGPFYVINPQIIELSQEFVKMQEGCLSIPLVYSEVVRPKFVTIEFLDENGNHKLLKAQCWLARCIQHEYDHLNGILYTQYLSSLQKELMLKKSAKLRQQKKCF